MKINFTQMQDLSTVLGEIADMKLPFRLSLIIAKDMNLLQKELEFYMEQERKFVEKYIEKDENGQFIESSPGMYQIKEELREECVEARKELNNFETDIDFRLIPVDDLENIEFTPKQIKALEILIKEE